MVLVTFSVTSGLQELGYTQVQVPVSSVNDPARFQQVCRCHFLPCSKVIPCKFLTQKVPYLVGSTIILFANSYAGAAGYPGLDVAKQTHRF